jgi:hypothetical protein
MNKLIRVLLFIGIVWGGCFILSLADTDYKDAVHWEPDLKKPLIENWMIIPVIVSTIASSISVFYIGREK